MERFLTTVHLGAAICLLAYATASTVRGLIAGADAFCIACFAAMAATAWCLMVRPAWAEYKQMRAERKGGRQ